MILWLALACGEPPPTIPACGSDPESPLLSMDVAVRLLVGEGEDRRPAKMPSFGLCDTHDGTCRICVKGYRTRGFGPGHRLTVATCTEHGVSFTLYPIGWVPYGRAAVVDRSGDWSRTLFAVVVSIAATTPVRSMPGYRRTHQRRVVRAGRWVGVAGPDRAGETAAGVLGVGLAIHHASRAAYASASGWHGRARAIATSLEAVRGSDDLWRRALAAGYHGRLCGRALQVCPTSGALLPLVRRRERVT